MRGCRRPRHRGAEGSWQCATFSLLPPPSPLSPRRRPRCRPRLCSRGVHNSLLLPPPSPQPLVACHLLSSHLSQRHPTPFLPRGCAQLGRAEAAGAARYSQASCLHTMFAADTLARAHTPCAAAGMGRVRLSEVGTSLGDVRSCHTPRSLADAACMSLHAGCRLLGCRPLSLCISI